MAERARAEAKAREWTQQHELLALNAEMTHLLYGAFVMANGGKKVRPFRIPRPGDNGKKSGVAAMSHEALMQAVKEG